jgi:hypothetical protein
LSPAPDPIACAAAILLAFSCAGVAHVLWLRSPRSIPLALPLDGGLHFRGRRLFGANKTLRGFVVLVPATALAFGALGMLRDALPAWLARGLWPLTSGELLMLGAWAAFWFMAGELPNSFLKRQWNVGPGEVPARGVRRWVCLVLDRVDSILALLIALSVAVPLAPLTALLLLAAGSGVHFLFSSLLYLARVKTRLA